MSHPRAVLAVILLLSSCLGAEARAEATGPSWMPPAKIRKTPEPTPTPPEASAPPPGPSESPTTQPSAPPSAIPILDVPPPPPTQRKNFLLQTSPVGDLAGRLNASFEVGFLGSFSIGPKATFLSRNDKDGIAYKDEKGAELGGRVTWYMLPKVKHFDTGLFMRAGVYSVDYKVNDDVGNYDLFGLGPSAYYYRNSAKGIQGELMVGGTFITKFGLSFEGSVGVNRYRKHYLRVTRATGAEEEHQATKWETDPLLEFAVGFAF